MDVVALLTLALIVYTYLGYPLVAAALAGLARANAVRIRRGSTLVDACLLPGQEPRVSVCMTVYNGATYITGKLESLLRLDYPPDRIEFLVYSDGSTDETVNIVRRFAAADSRIKLLEGTERSGKPTGLNALRALATGEILLMTDVRPPLAAGSVRALVAPLLDAGVGCVSGNLVLAGEANAGAYWQYEKRIRLYEARLGKMVGVSGTLYAIRKADMPELPTNLLLDDVWVPMQVALVKKRIVFAEAAEAYDRAFEDDREFQRKVRTLAGNYQLFLNTPRLLVPFLNPVWFQMMSHKVLRLLCPWALAVLFGASCAALFATPSLSSFERSFWRTLVFGQLAFYGLALIGPRAGRVAGLARTFVVLNAAAVIGLWRFARGSQRVTW